VPNETEWLTIEDIYEELDRKVPIDSIRQWIKSGRLKAYRPGKAYLIKREDFEKFLRESQTARDEGS
jgi:excisionase family DNA binding protein